MSAQTDFDDFDDGLPNRGAISNTDQPRGYGEQIRTKSIHLKNCPADDWEEARALWKIVRELDVAPADVDYERLQAWYEGRTEAEGVIR